MNTKALAKYDPAAIHDRILTIRGEKVILDADLALLFGVEIRSLNQQVKRNPRRFPEEFSFVLTLGEWKAIQALRSQDVSLKRGQHRKYLPRAFTEHGVLMVANVLNSPRAVQMSVFVVRAFVRMRAALSGTRELEHKLAALEREVTARLDSHDAAIVDILRRFMEILDPPALPEPPPKPIGFGVREKPGTYRTKKNKPRQRPSGRISPRHKP